MKYEIQKCASLQRFPFVQLWFLGVKCRIQGVKCEVHTLCEVHTPPCAAGQLLDDFEPDSGCEVSYS